MEKFLTIKSFLVDHTRIDRGIYISRIDGDITTYDIRFIKPNTPPYLDNAGMHTIEHLFATYVRNTRFGDNIIYVGPMGCRTGFYLLVRDLNANQVIELIIDTLKFIVDFKGKIPGASEKECGNYLEHDLEKAQFYSRDLLSAVKNWKVENLHY